MQPDQAGKPVVAVVISAGEAWRSMSQEEKDVSIPFSPYLHLSVIYFGNIVQKYKAAPSESTTA